MGQHKAESYGSIQGRNIKYYCKIMVSEIEKGLYKMKNGRVVGPDYIPLKVWKSSSNIGIARVAKLFNKNYEYQEVTR